MDVHPGIFREYDIRGLAEDQLSDQVAWLISKAFGTRMRREGRERIVLGRDVRESSPRLRDAFADGLRSCGLTVLDIGVVPTPTLYYAIVLLEADGGAQVTASHNPIEYNGFKLCRGISSVWGDELKDFVRQIGRRDFVEGNGGGQESHDVLSRYIDMVVEKTRPARPVKIAIDAANGTAGLAAPAIFEKLGHETTLIYCEPDGTFPNHEPDPTVEANMADLKKAVKQASAEIGVGFDGDSDRIGTVDGRCRMVWGDQLLALFARDVLGRLPGSKVIYDVKCSQALEEDIRAHGGVPIMWKTGHSLTKAKMKEEKAPLAGEMSGHMFFSDGFFGFDDAIYAAARLAAVLSGIDTTLAEMVDTLPVYVSSPELRVECTDEDKFRIVEEVAKTFEGTHDVLTIDGARVQFGDGWGLIRASNTQPVLVLRFEARSQDRLEAIEGEFRERLSRHPEVKWS